MSKPKHSFLLSQDQVDLKNHPKKVKAINKCFTDINDLLWSIAYNNGVSQDLLAVFFTKVNLFTNKLLKTLKPYLSSEAISIEYQLRHDLSLILQFEKKDTQNKGYLKMVINMKAIKQFNNLLKAFKEEIDTKTHNYKRLPCGTSMKLLEGFIIDTIGKIKQGEFEDEIESLSDSELLARFHIHSKDLLEGFKAKVNKKIEDLKIEGKPIPELLQSAYNNLNKIDSRVNSESTEAN